MIRLLRRKLSTWASLPRAVRAELPLAVGAAATARVMLKVLGLNRTRRWFDRGAALASHLRLGRRRPCAWLARDSAQAVKVAAAVLPGACLCLPRALATRFLLLRRGIETELVLGARLAGGGLDAHAWLQVDGKPLGEQLDAGMGAFKHNRPVGAGRA